MSKSKRKEKQKKASSKSEKHAVNINKDTSPIKFSLDLNYSSGFPMSLDSLGKETD
jgi:hypothetical protein